MQSKEEIERARNDVLRGNAIEESALILEAVVIDNYIIAGGRENVLKVATRQILAFIEESKDKGILDYAKENVKLKKQIKQ